MELIEIRKMQLSLNSYIKLSLILGLCSSIFWAAIGLVSFIFKLASGDQEVALFELLTILSSIFIGPIFMAISFLFGYPIYKYITNRWFSVVITVHGEREH